MGDRPFGITVVAVWQIAVGFLFAALILVVRFRSGGLADLGEAFSSVGISGLWVLVSTVLFAALSLVSGVALWQGERVGWWLASFCALYSIAGNLAAIRLLSWLQHDQGVEALTRPRLTSLLFRIGINGAILLYMVRTETMEYLEVSRERRFKYLLGVAGVVLSLYGLSIMLSRGTNLWS